MAKTESSLFRTTTIYTVGGVAGQVVPFLLLPILTRYLTPEDYGYVATFQAVLAMTMPFVGINVTRAITRAYYDYRKDDLSIYIGNCILIFITSFSIVCFIFFIFRQTLSSLLGLPSFWLLMVPAVAAFHFGTKAILTIWRVEKKAVAFSIFNIFLSAANILISIGLVVYLSMDWQGRILGIIIANLIFGAIGCLLLFRQCHIRLIRRMEYVRDAIRFGGPLIPQSLGEITIRMANRFFLNKMAGLSITGLFTVGYNLASIIAVLQGAFHQAWIPWLYEQLKDGCPIKKLQIVKFTYLYNLASIIIAILLAGIVRWLLPYIVGDKFLGASEYVLWIAIAFAADGMKKMMNGYILYEKKTHILMSITVITGVLSLLLNYMLIKINGPKGAAQAMAVSFFVGYILTWWMANRIHPMPWSLRFPKL